MASGGHWQVLRHMSPILTHMIYGTQASLPIENFTTTGPEPEVYLFGLLISFLRNYHVPPSSPPEWIYAT